MPMEMTWGLVTSQIGQKKSAATSEGTAERPRFLARMKVRAEEETQTFDTQVSTAAFNSKAFPLDWIHTCICWRLRTTKGEGLWEEHGLTHELWDFSGKQRDRDGKVNIKNSRCGGGASQHFRGSESAVKRDCQTQTLMNRYSSPCFSPREELILLHEMQLSYIFEVKWGSVTWVSCATDIPQTNAADGHPWAPLPTSQALVFTNHCFEIPK